MLCSPYFPLIYANYSTVYYILLIYILKHLLFSDVLYKREKIYSNRKTIILFIWTKEQQGLVYFSPSFPTNTHPHLEIQNSHPLQHTAICIICALHLQLSLRFALLLSEKGCFSAVGPHRYGEEDRSSRGNSQNPGGITRGVKVSGESTEAAIKAALFEKAHWQMPTVFRFDLSLFLYMIKADMSRKTKCTIFHCGGLGDAPFFYDNSTLWRC